MEDQEVITCAVELQKCSHVYNLNIVSSVDVELNIFNKCDEIRNEIEELFKQAEKELGVVIDSFAELPEKNVRSKRRGGKTQTKRDELNPPLTGIKIRRRTKIQPQNSTTRMSTRRQTRASGRMSISKVCDSFLQTKNNRTQKLIRTAKKTKKFIIPGTAGRGEQKAEENSFIFDNENAVTSAQPDASTPVSAETRNFISPTGHHHSPTHACDRSPSVKNLIEYHEHVIHSSEPENQSNNDSTEVPMETSHEINEAEMSTNETIKPQTKIQETPIQLTNNHKSVGNIRRSLHNELMASDNLDEEIAEQPQIVKNSLAPIRETSSQKMIDKAIRRSTDEEEKEKIRKISNCDPVIKLDPLPETKDRSSLTVRDSIMTSSSVCSTSANTIDMNDITNTKAADEEECQLNLVMSSSESETEVERPTRQRSSIYAKRRSSIRVISGKTFLSNEVRNRRTSARLSKALRKSNYLVPAQQPAEVSIKEEMNSEEDSGNSSPNNPTHQWEDTEVELPRPKIVKPVIKPKPKIKKNIPKHNAMSCGGIKRSRNVFSSKNSSFGGSPPKQKRFTSNTPQHSTAKTFFGTMEKARVIPRVNSFITRSNSSSRVRGTPTMGRSRIFSPFGRTPSHSNVNTTVSSFLARATTPQKINKEVELEAKKLQLEEKERKDEEIRRKREAERNEKIAESKKKRETRAQRATELREQRERKEKERQDLIQSQREQRHIDAETLKNQKLAEELAKIQKEKEKQANAEARRKEEMEEKNRKFKEQEEERLRKIELRQKQKKLADEQKAFEKRQEEERREQKRQEEERQEEKEREERRIAEEEERIRLQEEQNRKNEETKKLKKQKAEERKRKMEEKLLSKKQKEKQKLEAARLKKQEQEKEREEQERIEKEEAEALRKKNENRKKRLEEKKLQRERIEEERRVKELERKRIEQENLRLKKEEAERKFREQQEREEEIKEIERKEKEEIFRKKKEQLRQKVEAERLALEEKRKQDALKSKPIHNSTFTLEPPSTPGTSNLNSTYNKINSSNYDMTPRGPDRPLLPSTAENYNIDDLSSGDSTDDEDRPRKVIPLWAKGGVFQRTLLHQYYNPPGINSIFVGLLNAVNLATIFDRNKPRYFKRTSSAHWSSPIMPPGNRSFTSLSK